MDTLTINDRESVMRQLHGKKWDEYRRLWNEAGKGKKLTDFPIHLDFDVVDACNYKCVMCNEGDRKRTGAVMGLDFFKAVMKEGKENGLYSIGIGTIGEPLLYPDLFVEFIKAAKQAGVIDILMHTNAALLTKEISEKLIDAGVSVICFSMDAASTDTYKKIRGGNYDAVVKNILDFIAIKKKKGVALPFIRVSMVPFDLNRHEIDTFKAFWKDKVDVVEIQCYMDMGTGKNILEKQKQRCLMPFQRMMIWPDQRIGACCLGRSLNADLLVGRFPETTTKQAWNSEKMENLRKSMLSGELKDFPSCVACIASTYSS